jgi:hypothetical protein
VMKLDHVEELPLESLTQPKSQSQDGPFTKKISKNGQ